MRAAGLDGVEVLGLLVSAAVCDRAALGFDDGRDLDIERGLARVPALADSAKQLLAIGSRAAR
jgi:hypothetical protein